MEKEEMTRAERAAYMACPPDIVKTMHGEFDSNMYARIFFCRGYEQALRDMEEEGGPHRREGGSKNL